MIVLFLDVDGVANSGEYAHSLGIGGLLGIDPVAAARVRRIVAETGCSVVLSSTWRLSEKNRQEVRRDLCDFIDVTPDYRGKTDRGCEVIGWLKDHPEVTRHAILDDNSDFHDDQPLFLTTWKHGLTDEIADKVIASLLAPVDKVNNKVLT